MASTRGRPSRVLIPVRANLTSSSLSYWYCYWKFFTFNEVLYNFGQRYARFFKCWMTFGVAFSVIFLVGITVMLFWEAAVVFHLPSGSFGLKNILFGTVWGASPLVSDLSISLVDFAVMVFSTVISVTVHELGHAAAAASEGIPIEYVAIFLVLIFPGALIAFNNDLLQALPNIGSLRIYCAGIWHNAAFCALCWIALFMTPFTLHPLYIHGENVMVLGISNSSPLSGYLSRGDVILSIDGEKIRFPNQFKEKIVRDDTKLLLEASNNRKGYCVPNHWLEESDAVMVQDGNFSCPVDHTAFIHFPCPTSNSSFEVNSQHHNGYKKKIKDCLKPEQVVKLNKCGEGWKGIGSLINNCTCSEEESCMAPLLGAGISWFEISYSNPYSSECLQFLVDSNPGYATYPCGVGTFVYVGDQQIFTHSIQLSAYSPRSVHYSWIMDVPAILESMLACTYHVSAALAVLNSLPVFFLDGQYILESAICYIIWLTPRKRRRATQIYLITGTILSTAAFSRIIYFAYHSVAKS